MTEVKETTNLFNLENDAFDSYLEDDVVREALSSGVDLREYTKQIDEQLKNVELDAVKDYIKEAENIANLHNQIRDCDDILKNMELMLGSFQSDLGSISSEIQNLQEQSVQMNIKLKNRQALRSELSQFVDEIHVPKHLIEVILKKSASEREFLEQLHELQHKITFAKEQSFRDAHACLNVEDVLNKLKIKAVEKIREFLLQKIYQFRKPLTNYQIPQGAMLKFRFYYEFLLANERQVAREIREEYVDTMSKVFWTYFKTYAGRLMRLQMDDSATKDDLLGAEDTPSLRQGAAAFFSSSSAKHNIRNKATVFTLGNRRSVIGADLESSIIVTHAVEEKGEKFPFESLFRSLQYALMGNTISEYLFLCDFFMTNNQLSASNELFHAVMGKSLKILIKTVETYVAYSFDCIALLLCLHVSYRYQSILNKQDIRVLDSYFETLNASLWSRFEIVFMMNLDSVKNLEVLKVAVTDCRPHYIIRKYAEFSSALTSINLTWPDERLQEMLHNLQVEIDNLLNRLAAAGDFKDVSGSSTTTAGASSSNQQQRRQSQLITSSSEKKKKLIFLINNYDLILTTLGQNLSEETSETLAFQELLQTKCGEYIEELLFTYFGPLITFTLECERLIEQDHQESLKRHVDKIPILIKSFCNAWKKCIEQINQEVITSFSSLKQGSNVLQNALTQLVQYYGRFTKVLSCPAFLKCPARNDLISIHHIIVEVKKYKPVY